MEDQKLRTFAVPLLLLTLSVLINYIDRGNLATAATLVKDELGISATQLGILLSAFFWTYTAMQFVSGWIVDCFNVNLVLGVAYLMWSLATTATGLVRGFAALLLVRLLLGVAESVAFPSYSKILAGHLPEKSRGIANGAIMAGIRLGPAVGSIGAGLLMAKHGWRPVFIGIGLVSLLWLPAWARWRPRGNFRRPAPGATPGPPEILRHRSFWGASVGHFSSNYLLYFMVTWLPYFLIKERQLSMEEMSKTAAIFYLIEAASAMTAGLATDFFIRRSFSATTVRKSAMAVGSTVAAIGLIGCTLTGIHSHLEWLMTTAVGGGIFGSGIFAFAQTLSGPQAAGRWTGLQNGFANIAGIIAPAITGFLVNRTGRFSAALLVAAAVVIAGGLSWILVVGRLEQVAFRGSIASELARKVPEGA